MHDSFARPVAACRRNAPQRFLAGNAPVRTVPSGRGGRGRGRRGFTLLEILLVLAVFVAITALAMPSISNMFAGQQLRTAADVVRARFSDARAKAIRTGNVYGFFYKPGGGEYWVAPMYSGFQAISGNGALPSTQDVLENEIIFSAGETMQDARSMSERQNAGQAFASWRPILFYPDGTSQDAVVVLTAKSGVGIQVNLRGLTGVATRSEIRGSEEVLK
jgi:prepilin-type N-terminal cleavage/methylation domain-containing protein